MEKEIVQEVVVIAHPAQGHERRWRAGRAWGRDPQTVTVVKADPKKVKLEPNEITVEQYAAMKKDPHLNVVPKGEQTDATLSLQAQIEEKDKQIVELRTKLAERDEALDQHRGAVERNLGESAARIQQLEEEVEQLRAALSKQTNGGTVDNGAIADLYEAVAQLREENEQLRSELAKKKK